ncbi:MAG TPA: 30S ribosome-binding factor RbfA [Chitinophagales bacterium]|nr:30S ribosome-binding factor RbfA [Chitinophagales bacterium]
MDSRRQLKLGSVIKEAFTAILSRDGVAIYGKAFVTVTNVKVTSDLSLARFYVSIFNTTDPDAVIQSFYKHKHELKRKLAEKVRHQLRVMPEIEFFRDETLDYAYHIEDLFKKIKEEDEKMKAEIQAPKPEAEGEIVPEKKAAAKKPVAKKKAAVKKKAAAKKKTE